MRKTEIFVATKGRDAKPTDESGKPLPAKRFLITEMPALKAERWALRAILALAHSGVDLGDMQPGFAALAVAGIQALKALKIEDVAPLFDEMLECVRIMPDPKNPDFTRPLVMNMAEGDDIEEIATLWDIRERIFRLHADFFLGAKA